MDEPLRLLANAVPDSLSGTGCRALADEKPPDAVSDRSEELRHRTQLLPLLELRVQLGERRRVVQVIEPALETVDVALHTGKLTLDREDVVDGDGLAQELAQLVTFRGETLNPRLDVDRFLGDVLRRDVPRGDE